MIKKITLVLTIIIVFHELSNYNNHTQITLTLIENLKPYKNIRLNLIEKVFKTIINLLLIGCYKYDKDY